MASQETDLELVQAAWDRVYDIFDPLRPATADLHVPRDRYNPLSSEIAPRLQRMARAHPKFALAGGVGSGKSTELLATAARLDARPTVVFDVARHFTDTVKDVAAINRLQPWELLGILGVVLVRVGSLRPGWSWAGLDLRLGEALDAVRRAEDPGVERPSLEIGKLASGIVAAVGGMLAPPGAELPGIATGLALVKAVAESWSWSVGARRARPFVPPEAGVRAVLDAVNALLDKLRDAGLPLVVFLDGLDRIDDSEGFRALFVESRLLLELRCSLVVTLPLSMVQRYESVLPGWGISVFTFVPVVRQDNPNLPNPAGLQFFQSLCAARFQHVDTPPPLSVELIDRLAVCSGGVLRDFMRLMRDTIEECMLADAPVATREHVERAIDIFRRHRESGMHRGEIDTLREVLDDPERRLPPTDQPWVLDLLDRHRLLAYPNRSTWYLPHPILMMHILRRPGGSAA